MSSSRNLLTILFIFCSLSLFAQKQQTQEKSSSEELSTPYQTVVNHLKYLQDDNFKPAQSARSLYAPETKADKKQELAIKLKQVLDGKGIFIDVEKIPREANFTDSIDNVQRYYLAKSSFPDLYVEKIGSDWLYSLESVNKIETWHNDVYPFGTDKLLNLMPKGSTSKYLGIYLWQYVGLFIIIILAFVLHKVFTFMIDKLLIQLLQRMGYDRLAGTYLRPVAKPVSVLILFPLVMLLVPVLQLPIKVASFIILGLEVVWPVFAVIFFYRLVDIISEYMMKLAEKTESTLDDQLVPLLRKAAKTFVVLVGILIILDNLDVNITGIIAGLSIGGLAFALAAQDTIKNFFGSLMIFFDRPFQVGDWITSGDVDGTVEEVGFRATRIRTFRNSVMYIPNGVITNQMIDNHGLRVYRRFFTQISVLYDTPPEVLHAFTEGLKEVVKSHPKTRKDYFEVHVNNLASSAIEVMFYIFFEVPTWSEELRARHEVILLVMRLAKELNVQFAFPTQTLHVETLPEKANSNKYITANAELQTKVESFLAREFSAGKKGK